MAQILEFLTIGSLIGVICVTLAAGFIKGAIGFGMPLVMVSGLALFLEPQLAVAALILPILTSNLWQATRFGLGEAMSAVREYWRYVLVVCVVIAIAAQFVTSIPVRVFYLILGVPVVLLAAIQLSGVQLRISPSQKGWAEWVAAFVAGVLGGLTGTWGPPTVLYLLALDTPKLRAILVQGVVYALGAISLTLGHLQSGVLNAATLPLSAFLVIPGLISQAVGMRVSDRLNPEVFRRIILIVLIVAGLNLIRRGLFG